MQVLKRDLGDQPKLELAEGQFELESLDAADLDTAPQVSARAAQLADSAEWEALHRLMARFEREGLRSGGRPLTSAITEGVLRQQASWLEGFDPCAAIPARHFFYDDVERLEEAFVIRPDDHLLAAMLARAHLDMGWARRGSGWAGSVTEEGWEGLRLHLERANELVTRFDAVDRASPYLAQVTHEIALASEWPASARRTAFETCLRLNPKCWSAMRSEAFHCLPRWGGSHEELETTARQAMALTPDLGAAAYAAFYWGVLRAEEEVLFTCDEALLAEGLADLCAAENSDPVVVNKLIDTVMDTVMPNIAHSMEHEAQLNTRREAFECVLDKVFAEHFTCHVRDCWTMTEKMVRGILCGVYHPLLSAGGQLRLTLDGGIEITLPDSAGDQTPPPDGAGMVPAE